MSGRPVFVVQATEDPASLNIGRELQELLDFEEVHAPPVRAGESPQLPPGIEVLPGWDQARLPSGREVLLFTLAGLHIRAEGIGEHLAAMAGRRPEAVIVASRHRAASGKPSLTVHPVGNFGPAELGGEPQRLTPTHPALQTALLRALARRVKDFRRLEGYAVTFEATHHGPLTGLPLVYAEVGSGPEEWEVSEGGRAVALAIMDACVRDLPHGPVLFGVGGGHYAPRFSRLAVERACTVGHMLPSYQWEDEAGLERCVAMLLEALPRGGGLYLDRKGMKGSEASRVEEAARQAGVRVRRSEDLPPRTTDRRPAN